MRTTRVVYLFMALVLVAGALLAQGTGTTSSLSGTVTTDGKPLPGVTVTVASPMLQGTRTGVTGEAGGDNLPPPPPGPPPPPLPPRRRDKNKKKTTPAPPPAPPPH